MGLGHRIYDPLHNTVLSTAVAAVPIVLLLVHDRHQQGQDLLGGG